MLWITVKGASAHKNVYSSSKCLNIKNGACKISVTYMKRTWSMRFFFFFFFVSLLLCAAHSFISVCVCFFLSSFRHSYTSVFAICYDHHHHQHHIETIFFFRFVRKSMRISFQSEYRHSHLNPLFHGRQFSHHFNVSSESQSKIQKKWTKKI